MKRETYKRVEIAVDEDVITELFKDVINIKEDGDVNGEVD